MTESQLPQGLRAWAAMPGPASVLAAVKRRAYRGGRLDSGTLRIALTDEQRRQVARVLGTEWDVSGQNVTLRALNAALAEHGITIGQFVEMLDGSPLAVRRDELARQRRAAESERKHVIDLLGAVRIPTAVVALWLSEPRTPQLGSGGTAELAARIVRVWPRLPWQGPAIRLAQLAALTTGSAHGLDYSTDLGRAVARLIAATTGAARPSRPGRAWRAAWNSAGVRCDTVSSRVLTVNIPLNITAGLRRGAPMWLTLRDLLGPWAFDPVPPLLYVCENPTIVEAAADELGASCPPLMCTDGVPALSALELITEADARGVTIGIRADFDPTGFMIVETLQSAAPAATPWHYDTGTYLAHCGAHAAVSHFGETLPEAHRRIGRDVHEEALLALLLADLGAVAATPRSASARSDPMKWSTR